MELERATVLLVDDERMLLDIFSEWLHEENCRVLTAVSGAWPQIADFRGRRAVSDLVAGRT